MTHGNSVVVPVEPTQEMIDAGWNDVIQTPETIYRAMVTYAPAAPAPSSLSGGEVMSVPSLTIAACKGEQVRFEAWAKSQRYDMTEHPLHYIFSDMRTDAARMGWNAALAYVREAAISPEAPASEGGANRSHPCCGEHQPFCDCAIPTQTETEVPPFLKRVTDAKHEARDD